MTDNLESLGLQRVWLEANISDLTICLFDHMARQMSEVMKFDLTIGTAWRLTDQFDRQFVDHILGALAEELERK